jgi:hypothetical protein
MFCSNSRKTGKSFYRATNSTETFMHAVVKRELGFPMVPDFRKEGEQN